MCKWGNIITFKKMNPKATKVSFDVDKCIAPIVYALNKEGIYTEASCCGHGNIPGSIILEDGRELVIFPNYESARKFFKGLGRDIHGNKLGGFEE